MRYLPFTLFFLICSSCTQDPETVENQMMNVIGEYLYEEWVFEKCVPFNADVILVFNDAGCYIDWTSS